MSHQVPIVSGAYPMKIIPERYCVDVVQPEERHGDLLKINGNGMGFVLIHRQVFLDIARHYPNLKYIPSDYHSDTPHSHAEMNNSFHFLQNNNQRMVLCQKIKVSFIEQNKLGIICS